MQNDQKLELFDQIFQQIDEFFWVTDYPAGKIIYASAVYEKIWGRPLPDSLNYPQVFFDFIYPEDLSSAQAAFEKFMGQKDFYFDYRIVLPDQKIKWVSTRIYKVFDHQNTLIRLIGITRDIHERKMTLNSLQNEAETELRQSELKFRKLIESAPDGMLIFDKNNRIMISNDQISYLTGYSTQELQGKPFDFLFPEKFTLTEEIKDYEIYCNRKNGEKFPVEISFSSLEIDSASMLMLDIKDITDKKNSDLELKKYRLHLEELVKKRTLELTQSEKKAKILKEIAEASHKAKTTQEAMTVALNLLIEYFSWQIGHIYTVSDSNDDLLESSKIWFMEDSLKFNVFKEATEKITFQKGIGLPGTVMQSRKPIWIENIAHSAIFARKTAAFESGLVSGFAFPFIVNQKIASIFEFYSTQKRPIDPFFIDLVEQVNVQLAIVIERKEAEEELLKLSQALEQSPASVILTDLKGKIEYVNPKFSELTGFSFHEALGKNPRILKSGKTSDKTYQSLWQTLSAEKIWKGELLNRKKNGEEFWLRVTISPIKNSKGDKTHYIGVQEDVTERRKMEEDLLKAKEAAVSANQAKSEFLANMSHEIRTPMNAIIGFSHLLLGLSLSEEQREYGEKIESAAKNLLGVINDILDFSKIEAGKLNIESIPFFLDDVLKHVESMLLMKAQEKNLGFFIEVDPDIPSQVIGDPLRVGQVLMNLANNAVKFTQQGKVSIMVEKTARWEKEIELKFSVSDTGIGLSEEQKKKIFQPFGQADTSITRKFGGTGLGLMISKTLVELMGSHLTFTSSENQGSCFTFTISFKLCEKSSKKAENRKNLFLQAKKIEKEKDRVNLKEPYILLLIELKKILGENDPKAIGQIKKIIAMPMDIILKNKLTQLNLLIQEYNFEEAVEFISALLD